VTTEKTAPRRRVNSKQKGSSFEGQVAKRLSAALAPLTFIRVPGSGARVGGKNFQLFGKMFGSQAMKIFVGDVVPTNESDVNLQFKFSIECKSYKTSDSFESIVSGTANIFKWMMESVVDAAKVDRVPMLICKWNHTPTYVVVPAGSVPVAARITVQQGQHNLDIYFLDDLLAQPQVWYHGTTQPSER